MDIKIFCPLWGSEHMPVKEFLHLVRESGYDGVDTWLPGEEKARKDFLEAIENSGLLLVSHQHQATGETLAEYLRSYQHFLSVCLEGNPVRINSHSGRDYFPIKDQIRVIDTALEFSAKHGVEVLHEIHRGRIGYGPSAAAAVFDACPEMKITADFSHWVCVTENLHLTGFEHILEEAIRRTGHVHARVGFVEGPQVSDPRSEEWKEETEVFFGWWDRIVDVHKAGGAKALTITPEFGPYPYMWRIPFTNQDVGNQWEINDYMKHVIRERYSECSPSAIQA